MEPKQLIEEKLYTCIGLRGNSTLFALQGAGIKPLVLLYETAPGLLAGADVYDKVIGKAAAIMAVLSGANMVWGRIMSRSAVEYLESRGVNYGYAQIVERISNRTGDGICPLEASVLTIDDPAMGYDALKQRIAELMSGK